MISKVTKEDLAEFGILKPKEDKVTKTESDIRVNQTQPLSPQTPAPKFEESDSKQEKDYPGDYVDESPPIKDNRWQAFDFKDPNEIVFTFDNDLHEGIVKLHPWQIALHEGFAAVKPTQLDPHKFCLCAANGSGKDKYIVAPFAIWFTLTKVRSRVIITSSSGTQLTAQTETYIKDLAERANQFFGYEVYKIRQRYIRCMLSGSEIRMFATDEAGKAEGYHPIDANSEMAIIVNEAKSVSDEIFGALRRCTGYNYWLDVSTPAGKSGQFYKHWCRWENKFRVTSYDCPHLSPKEREEDRIELGESSPLFRSKHLAEFTSIDEEIIIPEEVVEKVQGKDIPHLGRNWPIRIGIDLAAGGDENALWAIRGNRVIHKKFFRQTDTTITAGVISDWLSTTVGLGLDHDFIFADDGGVGHAIIDMLCKEGWEIKRVNNQSPSTVRKTLFKNRGAQNWYRLRRFFEEQYLPYPEDAKTLEQLTRRKYKQSIDGRLALQSKEEARANGDKSPDRADGYVLAFTGLSVDEFKHEIDELKPKVDTNRLSPQQMLVAMEQYKFKSLDIHAQPKREHSNFSQHAILHRKN